MANFHIKKPSRFDVIDWCNDRRRLIVSEKGNNPEVIKKQSFAIKYGRVSRQEACNQEEAWRLADSTRVKVPCVYDFFETPTNGYLVMEFNAGQSDVDFRHPSIVSAVADALVHLHTFHGNRLGPTVDGPWEGLLWANAQPESDISVAELEKFINYRLAGYSDSVELLDCDLVFTHLDAAPRNIKITDDNVVCFLDWASAGYFPVVFEISVLCYNTGENGRDSEFSRLLTEDLISRHNLDPKQLRNARGMMRYMGNTVRYSL